MNGQVIKAGPVTDMSMVAQKRSVLVSRENLEPVMAIETSRSKELELHAPASEKLLRPTGYLQWYLVWVSCLSLAVPT